MAEQETRRVKFYRVVRFYERAGIRRRELFTTNSLAIAQGHCNNPDTSWQARPKRAKTVPARSARGSTATRQSITRSQRLVKIGVNTYGA